MFRSRMTSVAGNWREVGVGGGGGEYFFFFFFQKNLF